MKRYILLALSVCQSLVVLAAEAPRKSTDANLFGHVVDRETHVWGIERSGFFNGREKWVKGFENQMV